MSNEHDPECQSRHTGEPRFSPDPRNAGEYREFSARRNRLVREYSEILEMESRRKRKQARIIDWALSLAGAIALTIVGAYMTAQRSFEGVDFWTFVGFLVIGASAVGVAIGAARGVRVRAEQLQQVRSRELLRALNESWSMIDMLTHYATSEFESPANGEPSNGRSWGGRSE